MRSMRWRLGIAWIADTAIKVMAAEADEVFPLETGGVLLGYWAKQFTEVVITKVVGPGPRAEHRTDGFVPDPDFHEIVIAYWYEVSGGQFTYIGDWHSHPQSGPHLSGKDHRTLQAIAAYPDARAPVPLMGILSGGSPWALAVWQLTQWRLGKWSLLSSAGALQVRIFSEAG